MLPAPMVTTGRASAGGTGFGSSASRCDSSWTARSNSRDVVGGADCRPSARNASASGTEEASGTSVWLGTVHPYNVFLRARHQSSFVLAAHLDSAYRASLRAKQRVFAMHSISDCTAPIVRIEVRDIRFPTSESLDGSDAMHPDPDYSAAYVTIELAGDGFPQGNGLAFAFGVRHGNRRCGGARPSPATHWTNALRDWRRLCGRLARAY